MKRHLILTHEQADFDALGALLGAYLLDESATPMLPRRMNRNCRSFVSLYGSELPFVDPNDLTTATVSQVTLVDTQSLITLKGITPKTAVQIIDHHNQRPDLPPQWLARLEPTGACTTLFVAGLRERDIVLQPVHATLMLLGIYEDTGSLLYASTTARDAEAVGYLLEQGASLEIAARYLNPALSDEQRQVYDRLLADAVSLTVHNQTLVVAAADARELNDEISSIAHKIRDLLDPAALFILVKTGEGIRLVARSTTERVDVSTVAAYFGGGGHERAAAALLRLPSPLAPGPEPLGAARDELIRILPEHIRPAVTVRQVMSFHPRFISPHTSLTEAAQMMQRYGYEGFPVVEDNKVLGLLTRRAVDRALNHRLSLTVRSLMEAGSVTVSMDDSLDHLREVMSISGWGQIPVVDGENRLAGIVTRTDLLKHLGAHPGASTRVNLAAQMDASIPAARLALLRTVAAEAREHKMAAYIVGGFVRDLILNRPGVDFDIVVEGDAIALSHLLEKRFGGRIQTHSRFGTARWSLENIRADLAYALSDDLPEIHPFQADELPTSLDLISARTEFYDYPTALPTVERSSIKLDLHRRDFTINTLALRLDGRHYGDLYDYWGGLHDLKQGLVRVLHSLSFVDDPTRQLRAVRFEQRFHFRIAERTLQLMDEGRDLITRLSGDRLRHELNLILQEPSAITMLTRLGELGLLRAVHPALPDVRLEPGLRHHLENVLFNQPPDHWRLPDRVAGMPFPLATAYLVWLARLPAETACAVAQRIHLPGSLVELLPALTKLVNDLPGLNSSDRPSILTERFETLHPAALYAARLVCADVPQAGRIDEYVQTWRHILAHTNGEILRQRGIPPGPVYKQILARLRAAWLDGEINDPMQEFALLERILSAPKQETA
jgi:tRNA nucleotidyltransferase (CCA-adding enzyme)